MEGEKCTSPKRLVCRNALSRATDSGVRSGHVYLKVVGQQETIAMAPGKERTVSPSAQTKVEHLDAALDEALEGTFPASDPIAVSFEKPANPDSSETASRRSSVNSPRGANRPL